jgi:hypothetical protein
LDISESLPPSIIATSYVVVFIRRHFHASAVLSVLSRPEW